MKNKNMVIAGLVLVIVIIAGLIIFLVTKGNNDNKKDSKKSKKESTETKYELKDQVYEDFTISNIKIEIVDNETLVSFTVKNNTEKVYEEGIKVFSVEADGVSVEDVSSYLSSIAPNEELDVSVILNGKYDKIDRITIKE